MVSAEPSDAPMATKEASSITPHEASLRHGRIAASRAKRW
ncbi:MAG: hypothetical protein QOE19_631, partial [Actinomycetota bacterium]|nr:hypothetical protein [Actinomycetota bacterium]